MDIMETLFRTEEDEDEAQAADVGGDLTRSTATGHRHDLPLAERLRRRYQRERKRTPRQSPQAPPARTLVIGFTVGDQRVG